jgi:hypothetical protein
LRNAEDATDLGKGEFVPNFHDHHFALLARQVIHGRGQGPLSFIFGREFWLNGVFDFRDNVRFASRPAVIAAKKIKGDRTNSRVKQGAVLNVMIAPPKANERFLNNVFGVSR